MKVKFKGIIYDIKLIGYRSVTQYYFFDPENERKRFEIRKELCLTRGCEVIIILDNNDIIVRFNDRNNERAFIYIDNAESFDEELFSDLRTQGAIT